VVGDQQVKFTYNLPQDYLEVARAALSPIHGKVPADAETTPPSNELLNAVFAAVSVSIVFSFLALESYLNYQLFRLWEGRNKGDATAARFLQELGNPSDFLSLRGSDKAREVPARLKTICRILGFAAPHEAIPDTWRRLKELAEASRHFATHPIPEPAYFQSNMLRIMQETEAGAYVRVVEEVLSFLHKQSGAVVPGWVVRNELIAFRGYDLLPVQGGSKRAV
jgi:hypothetical protein